MFYLFESSSPWLLCKKFSSIFMLCEGRILTDFLSLLCNPQQFKNFPFHIQIGLIFFLCRVLYFCFLEAQLPPAQATQSPCYFSATFQGGHPVTLPSIKLQVIRLEPESSFLSAGTLTLCILPTLKKKKSNFSVQFCFTPEHFYINSNPFKTSLGESVTWECHFCCHTAVFFPSCA